MIHFLIQLCAGHKGRRAHPAAAVVLVIDHLGDLHP